MSAWHIFRGGQVLGCLVAVAGFVAAVAGILLQSERLGQLAALNGTVGVGLLWVIGLWSLDGTPTRPPRTIRVPKAERQRLAAERARIAVDAEIARLEREAGIR